MRPGARTYLSSGFVIIPPVRRVGVNLGVEGSYSLVLCTGYWDRAVFSRAADAVSPLGLLG
jgi:hypothetical protein